MTRPPSADPAAIRAGGPGDPATVAHVAAALPPGWRLRAAAEVGSTFDLARAAAEAGEDEGLVVWAGTQRSGRGRLGRDWTSPLGNLYCTILIRPDVPTARLGELTFVTALALADCLADYPGIPPVTLKWPNDVLIGGAKVVGILLEGGKGPPNGMTWVAIGAGVNVARHPPDAHYPTTSLAAVLADPPTVATLLIGYAAALARRLGDWRATGFAPMRDAWLARAAHLGDRITARLARETLHGRFDGLDCDGHLILSLDGGGVRTIDAADIFFPPD